MNEEENDNNWTLSVDTTAGEQEVYRGSQDDCFNKAEEYGQQLQESGLNMPDYHVRPEGEE